MAHVNASQDLAGKTFLVTGGNSGIGKATVEALAGRGAAVVLAARSEEKSRPVLEALRSRYPGASLEFLRLDLSRLADVKRAAQELAASGRPLDVLINNAGIAGVRAVTPDGFEATFGTNHLGPFLLTELLLPQLRASPQGRIVNVSSRAHARAKGIDWDALRRPAASTREALVHYGVSKLMNVLHVKELARRLAGTSVTTYALHPGVVASEIWREAPRLVQRVIKLFMISNEEGAKTSIHCATAAELSRDSGRYYDQSRERRPSALSEDAALAQELFQRSEEWVGRALGR